MQRRFGNTPIFDLRQYQIVQTLKQLWPGFEGFSSPQQSAEVAQAVLHVDRCHPFACPLTFCTTRFCKIRELQSKSVELALSVRSEPLDSFKDVLFAVPKTRLSAWFALYNRYRTVAKFALPHHCISVEVSTEQ